MFLGFAPTPDPVLSPGTFFLVFSPPPDFDEETTRKANLLTSVRLHGWFRLAWVGFDFPYTPLFSSDFRCAVFARLCTFVFFPTFFLLFPFVGPHRLALFFSL